MDSMDRRDFLKTVPLAAGAFAFAGRAGAAEPAAPVTIRLKTFDYQGVRLLDSRWRQQVQLARDYYFGLPNDDILHGWRKAAGLPAPGKPLGGWMETNSNTVLGQWLSGMARLSRATADTALRDKATQLMTEWGRTVKPDGDCGMSHYAWEKVVGGLLDMHLYAGASDALPLMERVTGWGARTLNRDRVAATAASFFGRPNEWYTLGENLYRAHQVTGDAKYRAFAEVWLYPAFWNKFADTAAPPDAHGVHAYSHVNTFSSAAMHYEIAGDPATLRILRNAYDYLQNTQCYATGGFGPDERFLAPDGALGRALDMRPNTFETVCGSWAGFKFARYLMRFTGEAKYGDWIERLLYNGVGAALPITTGGRNFYYSDYRSAGGMKVYRYDNYTCCSGTYFQNMAEYYNLIYFRDDDGLFVNLYVPSEATWTQRGTSVRIAQQTAYPEGDDSTLELQLAQPAEFAVRFRVPAWCNDMTITVNGAPANIACSPGTWATVSRRWSNGDRVAVRMPQRFRWQQVDAQHPNRVAIVRGPVVMPLEFRYLEPGLRVPQTDDDLNAALSPDTGTEIVKTLPSGPGVYQLRGASGRNLAAKVRPFYQYGENYPYLMYIDRDRWPARLW
jgi:uncharacterized protein